MAQKFFADINGNYIGSFDGTKPPAGGIQTPSAPEHFTDKWDGEKWVKTGLDYPEKRRLEYPDIGDQLDAIMKWVFTETEIQLPDELVSLAAKCMSVKAKYPKPENMK